MNRIKKRPIVFVSGVFDILHYGHVDFLFRAKSIVSEKNGQLIVAVHDDESVQKKKGKNRPINSLNDRVKVLEAVRYVDKVIPWIGWENIASLVKEIKPEYIAVCGDEHKGKTIGAVAAEINAELIVIPKIINQSTTKIIKIIDSLG